MGALDEFEIHEYRSIRNGGRVEVYIQALREVGPIRTWWWRVMVWHEESGDFACSQTGRDAHLPAAAAAALAWARGLESDAVAGQEQG